MWEGVHVGPCRHSDITVFSFHLVNIITSVAGGLLTMRAPAIVQRLADLRSLSVLLAMRHGWSMQTQEGSATNWAATTTA
ncbi:DegT/DnrJ/EryC1/StrS family aminotransferase [Laribacter hongkongensis]|uniref:DegT/DnrJ/EryC1/StrS family aminotransferase n=1 Tax=Laribacter hongkongensis TaxID=168471 RepID=UPI000B5998D0